ncbi:tyrosine-type recombinase/integrase [Streptosporangium soli]|nr:tyrosine-type recombinase/integrase [Streptosporangium sp. KLBMP 9127]
MRSWCFVSGRDGRRPGKAAGSPLRRRRGHTTASGRAIEPSNLVRCFQKACGKAKVRMVNVHATRKTCASLLVALDVDPRVAMRILRHGQIAVTMNIYSEVSNEDTRKALKRLGAQLDS